jgi:SagB-type dehydrogenase family enzyme
MSAPAYLAGVPSFTERYHELTKYRPETIDRLGGVRWADQPEPFKDTPAGRKIDLIPHLQRLFQDAEAPPDPLFPWLRADGASPVVPALARLTHCTLGLTARLSGPGGPGGSGAPGGGDIFLRAAPSAGGLYPAELYLAVREFPDLPAGLYHYHALRAALIPVWEGDFFADLRHHFLDHPAVAGAQCLALFTGLYGRSAWRYKERAYRRILLDTGHAAANLLAVAEAMGLDAVPLGGFYDEGLEELFFMTGKEEFPLLGVALGPGGGLAPAGGQRPGPTPEAAVRRVDAADPMQVQQNTCERLVPGDPPRPPVPVGGPAFRFDTADFNAQTAVLRRRSTRHFNGGSISLRDAEDMLRFAFNPLGRGGGEPLLTRGVIGFHLVAFAVEGLAPGVHAIDPETLALTLARAGDFRGDLHAIGLGQDIASECAFALVYTADMERLVSVYGDRGYRYACMDCGLIGERIQLWAVHRELGSSGIGGYYDDLANELLELPLSHGILYITVAGVPEE